LRRDIAMTLIPVSKIEWGPDDALARDQNFAKKWIEPNDIEICLNESYWLVSGEKGSGKTAICRALTEIYREQFDVIFRVDFDGIIFRPLYENIVAFAKATHLDRTVTLSQYWQYAIVMEIIKESAKSFPEVYGSIFERANRLDHSGTIYDRLMQTMENAWNIIDRITGAEGAGKGRSKSANLLETGGVAARDLSELSRFPLTERFKTLRDDFFKSVEGNNQRIVLVMDGLDKIDNRDIDRNSIGLIFSSLVDATITLKNYPKTPPGLLLKIIIPHDRYLSLSLRDSDKTDLCHVAIKWNKDSLEAFVQRRIEVSLKTEFKKFDAAWHAIMPGQVLNKQYGKSENTFEYLVRHTMHRPRQLQVHLNNIARSHKGESIESNMIPGCVKQSCSSLSRHFLKEYEIDHPNLSRLFQAFDRKLNVMEFKVFREIVSSVNTRTKREFRSFEVDDEIDRLFTIGFFGIVRFMERSELERDFHVFNCEEFGRYYVEFFFKNPRFSVAGILRDDTLVALHPIFIEGANLRPHPTMMVG